MNTRFSSPEIEDSVLSCCVGDPESYAKAVAGGITPESFTGVGNGMIFAALANHPDGVDFATLNDCLPAAGKTLHHLQFVQPEEFNLGMHIEILGKYHRAREGYRMANELIHGVDTNSRRPEEIVGRLEEIVDCLHSMAGAHQNSVEMRGAISQWLDRWETDLREGAVSRLRTGVLLLDEALGGGLPKGAMTVIGGATGSGKSALALQVAIEGANAGQSVSIFSLEMNVADQVERMVSRVGHVSMGVASNPGLHKPNEEDMHSIHAAMAQLAKLNIRFFDASSIQLSHLRAHCKAFPSDIVVVDYVQLVEGPRESRTSREREVAEISRVLSQVALGSGCTMISVSQLNDEGRLRESRAIGHDASCVLTVVEDGIRVDKNRRGPRPVGASVQAEFNGRYQSFE